MNITFLIGNGFDINVGLKTSYKDFLKWYKTNDSHMRYEPLDQQQVVWNFKEKIKPESKDWADCEKIVGSLISEYVDNVDSYYLIWRDFKTCLSEYLKQEEALIDYEKSAETINKAIMKGCLELGTGLSERSRIAVNGLLKMKKEVSHVYNFINFNYTSVLDKCIEISKLKHNSLQTWTYSEKQMSDKIGKNVHVHGTVEESLVMGVNDESQISEQAIAGDARFKRTFCKPETNRQLGTLRDEESLRFIDNSSIICVFGMSIGDTDKMWWQRVGAWLKEHKGRLLIIYSRKTNWNRLNPEDTLDFREDTVDAFLAHQNYQKPVVEQLKKQIHVSVNSDLFKMTLVGRRTKQ